MSNWLGTLIGAEIDRGDGGSGVGGAIEGYVIEGAVKVMVPLAVTFAIGWGVQYLARRAYEAATGQDAGSAPNS